MSKIISAGTDAAVGAEDSFSTAVERIRVAVKQAFDLNQPLNLSHEPDCIYVKSADGQILYANSAYMEVFSKDSLAVGRFSASFLQQTIVPVSESSDRMILTGCTRVVFDHCGHDAQGRPTLFQTAKVSLLGSGSPSVAILGVTRICQVLEDRADIKIALLSEKWNRFQSLDTQDRQIAVFLARGLSPAEIARQLSVAKRTIENHRRSILEKLGEESQISLAKLLVRLQDRGYGDLGV